MGAIDAPEAAEKTVTSPGGPMAVKRRQELRHAVGRLRGGRTGSARHLPDDAQQSIAAIAHTRSKSYGDAPIPLRLGARMSRSC